MIYPQRCALPVLPLTSDYPLELQAGILFRNKFYVAIADIPPSSQEGELTLLSHEVGKENWDILWQMAIDPPYRKTSEGKSHPIVLKQGCYGFSVLPMGQQDLLVATILSLSNPQFLFTTDGRRFQSIPHPQPDGSLAPLGMVTSYWNRLFAAPVIWHPKQAACTVWVSRNPRQGEWQLAAPTGFDTVGNRWISHLIVWNQWLYATVLNDESGFEIWKTSAKEESTPLEWQPVLTQGAGRYTLNRAITASALFQDRLYLGTAALSQIPELREAGDQGPEILSLDDKEHWQIVMGMPRFSSAGLKSSLSGLGPGFNTHYNSAITSLVCHEETLYALRQSDPWVGGLSYPSFHPEGENQPALWRTRNGNLWEELALPAQWVQTGLTGDMISTPYGLVLTGKLWRTDRGQWQIWALDFQ